MNSLRRILVPIDFGEASNEVLLRAVGLARPFDASVTLLHVVYVPSPAYAAKALPDDRPTAIENTARQRLEEAVSKLSAEYAHAYAVLRRGTPSEEILSALEDTRADLVVMGTGRHGPASGELGSVADRVVRLSPVPVMTVHPRSREPAPSRRELPREESSRASEHR